MQSVAKKKKILHVKLIKITGVLKLGDSGVAL